MNTKEILQGIKNWTTGKLDTKADKTATVSNVSYDSTNKKITKTINGTTSDVVTSEKVVEDGGGMNLVEGYYYNKKFYKEAAHTTEITGADGRIYIDKDTNREYRFDGTKYVLLKSEVDGSFVSEGTFTYRPTAGALDVESGAVGEGGAQIECIKGNTVAWNQLYNNSAPTTTTGHKYLISENNSGTVSRSISETISYTSDSTDRMCIDLTLIYGEGNEPSTVEQFEADYQKWFGKPLTYEEYDAGSLRSVEMAGIKTTGFNAWDEEWEIGNINPNTGGSVAGDNFIRSKNYIPVLPNTAYYRWPWIQIYFYDADRKYIDYMNEGPGAVFTTPSNCSYIKFRLYTAGSGYNHNICINLSHSGARDGEYEPYWTSTLNVPITTLKGKLNGKGNSVVVFPDGMKKAGTVYDEIVKRGNQTVAIKRIAAVDLGNYGWGTLGGPLYKCTAIPNIKYTSANTYLGNAICSKYPIHTGQGMSQSSADKTFAIDTNLVSVADSAYNDAATFKTAMSGVYLYYELATYEEYLLDDFELPQDYDVDDYGTEEVLLNGGVAPVLDIKYGINAPDTIKNLPHRYVSAVGEQNFTEAQKARARRNIGVISQEQLDALTRHTRKSDFSLDVLKQAVADQNLEKYGLKVGDYKTINGHDYVIAGLNCMKGSHPYTCTSNHVGLIVIPHTTQAWNVSGNTYTGADGRGAGYMNSDLHYYLKNTLLPLVETDLGAANLIGHSKLLSNAVADGKSSDWIWESDCKICALSEVQVYGSVVWGNMYDVGEADQQLEVFQHFKHTAIFGNEYPWLRAVVSASKAAYDNIYGDANRDTASNAYYVAALILFH